MAEHPELKGMPRTIVGKQVKRLRRQGLAPGVVYGPVVDSPVPISVDAQEFDRVYQRAGSTTLVDLLVDGRTFTVFIRETERHPVTRQLLNVEFYAPDLRRPIVALVPVVGVGTLPAGVDGVVTYAKPEVEIRALPEQIPHQIEIDLSLFSPERLAIHAGELPLPEGVELVTAPDDVIAVVEAGMVEAEEVAAPEAELAEEIGDRPAAVEEGAEPVEEE